jgi:glutathione S-transferase
MVVNRELGLGIEEAAVDLQAGQQFAPELVALNPNAKVPVLEGVDGASLWESNAIVNRLAAEVQTRLWPASNARYDIMRWQFWEAAHFAPAAAKFISRHLFGNESIDLDAAADEFGKVAGILDGHLAGRDWLVGDEMTTADISVSAILCYRDACHMPVEGHANILRWLGNVEAGDAWRAVNPTPQPA